MSLPSGTRLGPYEIIAPIGAGGMGEVYRARDTRLDREVAIKVLPGRFANHPDLRARFEKEAKAVAALNHPNILAIHDFGIEQGTPYSVTELLEGETLKAKMGGAPLPPRKAMEYALQIVHGLSAAHERGIVHRDLKPDNLFITRDGHLKILDFGLAKTVSTEEEPPLTVAPTMEPRTEPGAVLGTAGYMSPEQVRGLPVGHRSVIFAFGTIPHRKPELRTEAMNPAPGPAAGILASHDLLGKVWVSRSISGQRAEEEPSSCAIVVSCTYLWPSSQSSLSPQGAITARAAPTRAAEWAH